MYHGECTYIVTDLYKLSQTHSFCNQFSINTLIIALPVRVKSYGQQVRHKDGAASQQATVKG